MSDHDIASVLGGPLSTADAEQGGFEPLPPAWYPAEVEVAEVKKTASGNGIYLKVKLVVIGENYAGRVLFAHLNLENPNPKAVEIGRRELASLGQACGISEVSDTTQLLGKQVSVRVRVSKEANKYGEYDNDVVGYRSLTDSTKRTAPPTAAPTADPKAAPAAAVPTAPAAAAKLPWQK